MSTWYAANAGNDSQGLVVEEETGRNVAVTYDAADARLVAAAPALAEALRELLDAPARSVPRSKRTRTIHVREAPARSAPYSGMFALPTWRDDWRGALARARAIYAIPSRYPLEVRHAPGVDTLTEERRKMGVFA